jgi:tetratricopeptide (TPR) repeat protein
MRNGKLILPKEMARVGGLTKATNHEGTKTRRGKSEEWKMEDRGWKKKGAHRSAIYPPSSILHPRICLSLRVFVPSWLILFLALPMLMVISGCTDTGKPAPMDTTQLSAGYRALAQNQPQTAIDKADEYLRAQPHGSGAAEAFYLKGRGYEALTAVDPGQSKRNQVEARMAFMDALNENPSPALEGNIRADLSNVAFYQDDFPAAYGEANKAMKLVSSPDTQAMLLYRMGMSQQRMGQFTDADATFAQVQQKYPSSPQAKLAQQHQGLRDFYVQLATFANSASADSAMQSLQGSGLVISKRADAAGHTVVDAGPLPTYDSAVAVKEQLAKQYPDAVIKP